MDKEDIPRCRDRRKFLGTCIGGLAAIGSGLSLQGCGIPAETETRIQVPPGFNPRLVARSGYASTAGGEYLWHAEPDGGGCFPTADGGWIYVSNCETFYQGAVGALRFDSAGQIIDSYPILTGTRRNCAGGVTPWGTWLSCEEVDSGLVWECDPLGIEAAVPLPAFGVCRHESAAVDPANGRIYLTEDQHDGCLYRFTPHSVPVSGRPDLETGLLEIARVDGNRVSWMQVPDPTASSAPLRHQIADVNRFPGAEGISIVDRNVRFVTKSDSIVWQLGLDDDRLEIFDDLSDLSEGIDALAHTASGKLLLASEGGDISILYYPQNDAEPVTLVRLLGHGDSEITGLAFDPSNTRLYFSSQQGSTGRGEDGLTFELQGDFSTLADSFDLVLWELEHASMSG